MPAMTLDPASIEGKDPDASAHVAVLVVGGGPAGLSAAKTLAKVGIGTMLVEEHPVSPALMALDVPLHFGQRMMSGGATARRLEQIIESTPGIAEAYELGIDVQLGVCVWGIFHSTRSTSDLQAPLLVGLADEERSWFVSCDRIIIASGSRDLAVGFPGWEKPGVMGALAALQLIERYDAFTGTSLLVLGAGALAHRLTQAAARKGIEVVGIVDVESTREETSGQSAGVPLYARHVLAEVRGTLEVESAVLVSVDDSGRPLPQSRKIVACDTVVLAIGAVPTVDLLDSLGCRLDYVASRGGWVPRVDLHGETSVRRVYAAGDCAGLGADAGQEGLRVAAEVAASLGARPSTATVHAQPAPAPDTSTARVRAWMHAQTQVSGLEVIVCQCEEVTRRELLELKAPRYVIDATVTPAIPAAGTPPAPCTPPARCTPPDLRSLASEGPLHQDQVKRLTRAGMGPCQGRRCREHVQLLLETAAGCAPGEVALARYRPPVRPLPLQVLALAHESEKLREHWVAWFNISTQWLPHWEVLPAPLNQAADTPAQGHGE
jgi:thioredoxin reductase